VLATLRDWLNLDADPRNPFLPSPRIKNAPTLDPVLTLDDTSKNTNWPVITAKCIIGSDDTAMQTPLSELQKSLLATAVRKNSDNPTDPGTIAASTQQANALNTYADAINFMHPGLPQT
jgi:hypothetical protein